MERIKGKAEVITQVLRPSYIHIGPHRIVDVVETGTLSEGEQIASLYHFAYCWNAFEEGGPVKKLVETCEDFASFADTDVPKGFNVPEEWLGELRHHAFKIKQAIAKAKEDLELIEQDKGITACRCFYKASKPCSYCEAKTITAEAKKGVE